MRIPLRVLHHIASFEGRLFEQGTARIDLHVVNEILIPVLIGIAAARPTTLTVVFQTAPS
jgi:hypothetical protein